MPTNQSDLDQKTLKIFEIIVKHHFDPLEHPAESIGWAVDCARFWQKRLDQLKKETSTIKLAE